jgi:hypothetical protein
VDKVRRPVQNDTLGHRGRRDDPLYRIRRIALVDAERLNQKGWQRLHDGLAVGDPSGDLASAWVAKELFRNMYAAKDRRAAHRALIRFYTHCAERDHVPELVTLAGTVCLGNPDPGVSRHQRSVERPDRGRQPPHREDPPDRARIPIVHQLPPPPVARMWRHLGNSPVARIRRQQPRSAA